MDDPQQLTKTEAILDGLFESRLFVTFWQQQAVHRMAFTHTHPPPSQRVQQTFVLRTKKNGNLYLILQFSRTFLFTVILAKVFLWTSSMKPYFWGSCLSQITRKIIITIEFIRLCLILLSLNHFTAQSFNKW